MVNTFPYTVYVTPRPCYFQALSWTGCGSFACRWVPGGAEEAVRSDCPLSVLPARWTGWMRMSVPCLLFSLPISFYGVKSWRNTKIELLCWRKSNPAVCQCIELVWNIITNVRKKKKITKSIIFYPTPYPPKMHCAPDKANTHLGSKSTSCGIMLILHSSQAID